MATLNLTAASANEKVVLQYLNSNASLALADRINNGTKTLAQCWNYIISEAKKLAKNGVACVADNDVFGWAIHFFEEDGIKGEAFNKSNGAVKTAKTGTTASLSADDPQPTPAPAPKKKSAQPSTPLDQISFESLFGDI